MSFCGWAESSVEVVPCIGVSQKNAIVANESNRVTQTPRWLKCKTTIDKSGNVPTSIKSYHFSVLFGNRKTKWIGVPDQLHDWHQYSQWGPSGTAGDVAHRAHWAIVVFLFLKFFFVFRFCGGVKQALTFLFCYSRVDWWIWVTIWKYSQLLLLIFSFNVLQNPRLTK